MPLVGTEGREFAATAVQDYYLIIIPAVGAHIDHPHVGGCSHGKVDW
jgi:hypothetical protein